MEGRKERGSEGRRKEGGKEGGKEGVGGVEKRKGGRTVLNCGFRSNQNKNTLEQIKTRYSLSLEKHIGKKTPKHFTSVFLWYVS